MKAKDILARQSRPQRFSTWVPRTRDWRYATGVFQHHDFEDAPKDRSAWDTMDYDYQTGGDTTRNRDTLSRMDSKGSSELEVDRAMLDMGIPHSGSTQAATESPQAMTPTRAAKMARSPPNSVWASLTRLNVKPPKSQDDTETEYEAVGLIVRLRFTDINIAGLQRITNEPADYPPTPQSLIRIRSPRTFSTLQIACSSEMPANARTAYTIHSPHILDSIESIHAFPLFSRLWIDETRDFNMKTVRLIVRGSSEKVDNFGPKYQWYADAVPVDAIFPPGVPLSAKEINAYYPHHVRRKGIMLRLTSNDYRGPDILGIQAFFRGSPTHAITIAQMNNYQRDTVKSTIPGFKTLGYKGKPDLNLYTDNLALGRNLEETHKSFSLPSFDDLLRGLQHLPTGLDARGLTQCLAWYLNFRDSFTPRLELNVLHTQALIRALRQPLKPFGPQNLDRNALQEWRDKGGFDDEKVSNSPRPKQSLEETTVQERTRLHMNLDNDSVQLQVTLPVRHIFTFPFVALHGLVGEALKMGIEKAQVRQAEREGQDKRRALEATWAAGLASNAHNKDNTNDVQDNGNTVDKAATTKASAEEQPEAAKEKLSYRIPKRPPPAAEDFPPTESTPKKPRSAPLLDSAYGRRDFQSRPPDRHQAPAYRRAVAYPQSDRYPQARPYAPWDGDVRYESGYRR